MRPTTFFTPTPIAMACCGVLIFHVALLSAVSAAETQRKTPGDKEIAFAVENQFRFDKSVPWHAVDAQVSKGTVTLTGTVNNLLDKERATALAQTVRGVQAVVNNITVNALKRADEAIRKDVETTLANDPAADVYEITTQVNDGVVTLSGKVQSHAERELATQLAKGIKGVREVKSQLEVNYKTTRADDEIAADVRRILEWDVWVNESFIDASVKDGKVTLTGSVASAAQKTRAKSLASVAGVKEVDVYGLKVEGWLADDMRKKQVRPPKFTDETIKTVIEQALMRNPRVNPEKVNVEIDNGKATLSGKVDNLQAKTAAEQEAMNTIGVRRVKNLIKVRPEKALSDDELAKNISRAFASDPYADGFDIKVKARNGWVTLEGTVDTSFEKTHALSVAQRQAGVIAVNNNIQVEETPSSYVHTFHPPYNDYPSARLYGKSDAEIAEDVRDELFWSPFVDAEEVTVSVSKGVAKLSGTVDSWFESHKAEENAWEGGAASIDNELKIE